jgi:hypothetical protein
MRAALVLVLLALVALTCATTAQARQVTFVNAVDQTVWVGGASKTNAPTGFALAPGATRTITVGQHFNGRFWGRTGCRFDAHGKGRCATGDCDGRLRCTGFGAIPATLAEFNLDAYAHLDFYDVSLVDGSNLPMWINRTGGDTKDPISKRGCSKAGCTKRVTCPASLKVRAHGKTVACGSPCSLLKGDRYCCAGQFAQGCNPATTWPVDYAKVFKRAEPFAYSWSGDDATSTFTCKGQCDYRITFGVTPT